MKIMKNTTSYFTKITIGLFITIFVISCNTQQGQKENEHNDMMDDDHTEIMEDTTMMETNEEMMY
ncbi:MAG: hypothetical protein ACJAZM_001470 [Cyclobacteriaceae bacterium]|jgi:hypothetical protein